VDPSEKYQWYGTVSGVEVEIVFFDVNRLHCLCSPIWQSDQIFVISDSTTSWRNGCAVERHHDGSLTMKTRGTFGQYFDHPGKAERAKRQCLLPEFSKVFNRVRDKPFHRPLKVEH